MTKLKHICFLVPNYPTKSDPVYTFVRELVCEIANKGIKCSVIAPQSITNFTTKRKRKRPLYWQDVSNNNYKIDIYQPITAHFLKFKILDSSVSALLTEWSMNRAFKKLKETPDVLYAHFWHSGVIAGGISNRNNIPFFVASGESKIWVKNLYGEEKIQKNLNNVKGVISVSTKNKHESIDLNLISPEKIEVIPNSINEKLFYSIDKNKARAKLGFDQKDFIVAYTGAFTHRKGVLRLSDALNNVPGIKSIFIGKGELEPSCYGILFKGQLPHDYIVTYLNAADVFVLPTLAEGCSNAIIEAMACGLPIVSSNLSFNNDILNNQNSIRIDSNEIDQITNALIYLKENQSTLELMSNFSFEKSKDLNIKRRAKKIINFMNKKV